MVGRGLLCNASRASDLRPLCSRSPAVCQSTKYAAAAIPRINPTINMLTRLISAALLLKQPPCQPVAQMVLRWMTPEQVAAIHPTLSCSQGRRLIEMRTLSHLLSRWPLLVEYLDNAGHSPVLAGVSRQRSAPACNGSHLDASIGDLRQPLHTLNCSTRDRESRTGQTRPSMSPTVDAVTEANRVASSLAASYRTCLRGTIPRRFIQTPPQVVSSLTRGCWERWKRNHILGTKARQA